MFAIHVFFATAVPIAVVSPARAADIPLIDAHSQVDDGMDMDRVLSLLDQAGIARAILSNLRSQSKLAEIIAAARQQPDRITPSIGLKSRSIRAEDPSALQYLRRAASRPAIGAISEFMLLHQQKGNVAPEIVTGFDSALLREVMSAARERHWPLVVHLEFGFARERHEGDKYLTGLERFLDANADLPVALTHMGQLDPGDADRLIGAHGNIYFLTSHANTVWIRTKGYGLPWTDLFEGRAIAPDWRALMVHHPDRFVLAFDNVQNDDWNDTYVRQADLWKTALADLPDEVAQAIAHRNAERLWHLPPVGAPASRASVPENAAPAAGGELVGPMGLTAREIIARFDADGDGKLNQAEFQRPPQLFRFVDANHDGFVTRDELEAAWRKMKN